MDTRKTTHWEWIVLAAAGTLLVTQGMRQSMGLFIAPIDASTGLGIASMSFALAIAQFTWGAVQPIAGAVADRYGPGRVMATGLVLLALGNALASLAETSAGFAVTLGVIAAAGAGAASFSVLMGAASRLLPSEKRGFAAGVINAGGSFGQFVFAPLLQVLIAAVSWTGAFLATSLIALAVFPLTRLLRAPATSGAVASTGGNLRTAVREALGDRSYLLLHAGFFTCGFHIAFLVTHLPGEIALCGLSPTVASWSLAIIGLANVAGSLAAGWGVGRYLSKHVLFTMYASRTALILLYLAAPKTAVTFYIFAAGLGATWLATIPPTATVVGKLFGARYLSTLFGLTLLTHQIGGFLGAWLGGIVVTQRGSYDWMWYMDAGLALMAAFINLPIREPQTLRVAA